MELKVKEVDPKKEAAALMEKALSGKGFVLFAAVLTDKKNKDGNFILDFHYLRHHYGFEDVRKAVDAFRMQAQKDAVQAFS
jgi:hypothetical protein